jgi:hypothetical protein
MEGHGGREIMNSSLGSFGVPWVFIGEVSNWSTIQMLLTPPRISVLSPQTRNYSVSDVPLNFTTDDSVSEIAYSLDGHENVTVAGNTTLSGLSNGAHNVKVYVYDTYGISGKTETINFTVAESFSIVSIVAVLGLTVLVVGAGVTVYFKRRHIKSDK